MLTSFHEKDNWDLIYYISFSQKHDRKSTFRLSKTVSSVSRHLFIILNLFVTQAMSPLYVKNLSSNLQHDQGKIMPFFNHGLS